MKKIFGLIALFLMFTVPAMAETFTETDVGGDTVDGVIRVVLTKTISTDAGDVTTANTKVEVAYATYDSTGKLIRRGTVDITGDLTQTQLDKVDVWINTGKTKAKGHANIP